MAKFNAATAVEALEYDFTAYKGGEGIIPEPSTGAVNVYFKSMKALVNDIRKIQGSADAITEVDDDEQMSDEELDKRVAAIDELSDEAAEFQGKSVQMLADLCSNTPNAEDLAKLPYRVLQEFTRWLITEIRPKAQTPGTKR